MVLIYYFEINIVEIDLVLNYVVDIFVEMNVVVDYNFYSYKFFDFCNYFDNWKKFVCCNLRGCKVGFIFSLSVGSGFLFMFIIDFMFFMWE